MMLPYFHCYKGGIETTILVFKVMVELSVEHLCEFPLGFIKTTT